MSVSIFVTLSVSIIVELSNNVNAYFLSSQFIGTLSSAVTSFGGKNNLFNSPLTPSFYKITIFTVNYNFTHSS